METKLTYAEQLKDPRWQRRRLEVMKRDEFACRFCGSTEQTLHVDHIRYSKGAPWEIDDKWLQTLCELCHEDITAKRKEVKELLERTSIHSFDEIIGFMKGHLLMSHEATEVDVPDTLAGHDQTVGIGRAYGLEAGVVRTGRVTGADVFGLRCEKLRRLRRMRRLEEEQEEDPPERGRSS